MSVPLMASCQMQDQKQEERRGTRGERRKGETGSMTGRETLKQNRRGSKGERDTRKPEKPSPEPALAGCETEAHTRIFLCPLKILSVGRPRLATCSLPPPSTFCSVWLASRRKSYSGHQGLKIQLVP